MKVLIIEDDSVAFEIARGFLPTGAHTYVHAKTILEAKEALEDKGVDFIIADLNLPDGSPADVQALVRGQNLPFVFVTGTAKPPASATPLVTKGAPFSQLGDTVSHITLSSLVEKQKENVQKIDELMKDVRIGNGRKSILTRLDVMDVHLNNMNRLMGQFEESLEELRAGKRQVMAALTTGVLSLIAVVVSTIVPLLAN